MNEKAKICMDIVDAELVLHGIHQTTAGLNFDARTLEGVLTEDKSASNGANAVDWLQRYYDITEGVLLMIEGATGIITRALTDGDLQLVGKEARS